MIKNAIDRGTERHGERAREREREKKGRKRDKSSFNAQTENVVSAMSFYPGGRHS